MKLPQFLGLSCLLFFIGAEVSAAEQARSHPPLRQAPPPSQRPMDKGPAYFVDAQRGDDKADGLKDAPWKTLGHAVGRLKPGDTLYIRGGTYYEQLAVCLTGTDKEPITIRSHPGEQAIIDGGLREFSEKPANAWQPLDAGEYRSTKAYPNVRDVIGSFGDSMVGLQTYHHAKDLRAASELWDWEGDRKTTDAKPVYCGPGVWYDPVTGHIHARLLHTHLPGVDNYAGETDPRKLPLVLAAFRAVPLHVDGARHVRFQDLVIRGGGHDTIVLHQAVDITFDNVTIWCASNGIRAEGTRNLKLLGCGLHGNAAPWTYRSDTSLRTRPGSPYRDITRFNTHALLVPEGGREFSVFAFPRNDDWEIAYCAFTDAHDAVYLGAINVRFHHNLVHNMQDDGLYLSPMYPRYGPKAELHIYQNYIGRCLTPLAFGGPEKTNDDTIYLYRNVIDERAPVNTGRPTSKEPKGSFSSGHVMGDHGSPPWSKMFIYQNTFIMGEAARTSDMATLAGSHAERPRRVFNNIFVHLARMPDLHTGDAETAHSDGNLYWHPGFEGKRAAAYFDRYRASPAFEKSKKSYLPGLEAHSILGDPKFTKLTPDGKADNDYRPQPGSAAADAGVELPAEWPDPLRKQDKGKPDIGALPVDAEPLQVGPQARK